MATITDLVHDVIGYLFAQCSANVALGNNGNGPVTVFDGPGTLGEQSTDVSQALWIGWDAIGAGTEAAAAVQKWSFLGQNGNFRDEDGEIICTAQAWSGDTVPANSRIQCKLIVGALETMLRGVPPAGPGDSSMGNLVQWSQVSGPYQWHQTQASQFGYSAACVFRVQYFARLAP